MRVKERCSCSPTGHLASMEIVILYGIISHGVKLVHVVNIIRLWGAIHCCKLWLISDGANERRPHNKKECLQ